MRAVLQRVSQARVQVDGRIVGQIGCGLLVYLGVMKGDIEEDALRLVRKIPDLRVFEDENGKMNRSLLEVGGAVLVVSQFTLAADCRKGRRPSFDAAADPETARTLYQLFVDQMRGRQVPVQTGEFQAMMDVYSVNDGPVTLWLDSRIDQT
ncbi:MAG: D-aminoacyl-tRNA deacylase [Acidobacteriia bacterium]|nr:D-aminoacyl-tRNA deacylase [Terriglobia bacterium]